MVWGHFSSHLIQFCCSHGMFLLLLNSFYFSAIKLVGTFWFPSINRGNEMHLSKVAHRIHVAVRPKIRGFVPRRKNHATQ